MNEFLNGTENRERMRRAQFLAMARKSTSQDGGETIRCGDAFLFDESLGLPVQWVAIRQHKDDESLWYMIAADEFPLVGSCDIELPDANEFWPLVLRCRVGFWAQQQDVDAHRFVGRVKGECLLDAQDRLSEMVFGDVPNSVRAILVDEDPDYEDWSTTLHGVCESIEVRIQAEPIFVRLSDATTHWGSDLHLVTERSLECLDLAADSVGKIQPENETTGVRLKSKLPGKLFVVVSGNACDLQYAGASTKDQPPRAFVAGQTDFDGTWEQKPGNRWLCRGSISLAGGDVRFRVGTEKFVLLA